MQVASFWYTKFMNESSNKETYNQNSSKTEIIVRRLTKIVITISFLFTPLLFWAGDNDVFCGGVAVTTILSLLMFVLPLIS